MPAASRPAASEVSVGTCRGVPFRWTVTMTGGTSRSCDAGRRTNRALATIMGDLRFGVESGGGECAEQLGGDAVAYPGCDRQGMLGGQRDAAVAGRNVGAGAFFGFLIDGEAVGRHDAQGSPAAHDAYIAQGGEAGDGPGGDFGTDGHAHRIVVAGLFHGVADLNRSLVGLTHVVRGAA